MGVNLTRTEVADLMERFLSGNIGTWEWDDFISLPINDPELEKVRMRCATLDNEFPATQRGHYCGPEGFKILEMMIKDLRKER